MKMEMVGFFGRRLWLRLFVCLTLLLAVINCAVLLAIRGLAADSWVIWSSPPGGLATISLYALEGLYWYYFLPISAALFALFGLITGGLTIRSFRKLIPDERRPAMGQPAPPEVPEKRAESRVQAPPSRRLFLHLLSVLQRDGRLLDFLYEDLADYDDAQIGAAVRNIHENCRNVVDTYLAPEAIVAVEEGASILIPPDFDVNQFKLSGNVQGRPPFTGVVQHRGWRMGKKELPVLLAEKDSVIIAPAEVEIQ